MKIVLVSMDCVRPDQLRHRFFDRLRNEGVSFDCCVQASHTSTSHTSLLGGFYPFHHGVRYLVDFNNTTPVLPQILREQGYTTAAFIGGFPLSQGNLAEGFDTFEHQPVLDDWKEGRGKFCPANVVVMQAVNWLNDVKGDAFAFLHFFDAHFTLRAEFVERGFPERDERGVFRITDEMLGRRRRRYQEEIDFMGAQLELLWQLAEIDLLVVTADHGDKLDGEKRYPWVFNIQGEQVGSHFHEVELWECQLRVPLFFMGVTGSLHGGRSFVRSIDVAPTIMELIGLTYACDGVSLLSSEIIETTYAETYFAQFKCANRHVMEMDARHGWGWKQNDSLVALRQNDYKLICTANGKLVPHLLFDLRCDPQELVPLEDEARTAELFATLEALLKEDHQWRASGPPQIDAVVRERLAALGYL